MAKLILDASVFATWLLQEEDSNDIETVIRLLEDKSYQAIIPSLFYDEVMNVLLKAKSSSRISPELFTLYFNCVLGFCPLFYVVATPFSPKELTKRALLAQKHNLRSYDAVYLSLALTQGIKIATADKRLARAATAEGCLFTI